MSSVQRTDDERMRDLHAAVWRAFFARPGDRQLDASGFWSMRLGVRVDIPQYSSDSTALARIEEALRKRGLWMLYSARTQAFGNLERTDSMTLADKLQIAVEIMSDADSRFD